MSLFDFLSQISTKKMIIEGKEEGAYIEIEEPIFNICHVWILGGRPLRDGNDYTYRAGTFQCLVDLEGEKIEIVYICFRCSVAG